MTSINFLIIAKYDSKAECQIIMLNMTAKPLSTVLSITPLTKESVRDFMKVAFLIRSLMLHFGEG